MKITAQELHHLAAADAPRHDLYTGIHKALRALMADTLLALGRLDTDDEAELAEVASRLLQLCGVCEAHLTHENAFVHPALEAKAPGTSGAVALDHEEHLRHTAALAAQVALLQCAAPARRPGVALRLYRELALFIADNFQHMAVEESAHNAALWAHYSDAELVALHDALVASIPPQEMRTVLRWLVPSLNPAERHRLLADLRTRMPADAFDAVLEAVQPHLDARGWAKLARALGLAPVPGLVAA